MGSSGGYQNPITANPGEVQHGVDPTRLQPSRGDLIRARLEYQRFLLRSGRPRFTMIQVSRDGVIVDGHHAVRAAAEEDQLIDIMVSPLTVAGKPGSILDLNVR